jgi:thiamine biosynthesis lipoprotein
MRIYHHAIHAMATRFEIILIGRDNSRLQAAAEEAADEILQLNNQLNCHDCNSDISEINAFAAQKPLKINPQLFRLLKECKTISRQTGGTFDITLGSLIRLWQNDNFSSKDSFSSQIPVASLIQEIRNQIGYQHVILNEENYTVYFDIPGISIDLGAIGKGYAIQKIADNLRQVGITSGFIHGGGSTMFGWGNDPIREKNDQKGWLVAIQDPRKAEAFVEIVELQEEALSVSAIHGKSFWAEGKQFGHIISPATGYPVYSPILAAVKCQSALVSDALSTALLVSGEQKSNEWPLVSKTWTIE